VNIYSLANYGDNYIISDYRHLNKTYYVTYPANEINIDNLNIDNILNTRHNNIDFNILLSSNYTKTTALNIKGDINKICNGSDYESWTLSDNCINGEVSGYLKQKEDAKCVNNLKYPILFKNTKAQCNCKEEDFECDNDFIRDEHACVHINPNYYKAPLLCTGYFSLYNGVKLIEGNKCKLTNDYQDYNITTYVCPNYFSLNSYSTSTIIIVLLILLGILIYCIRKCLSTKPAEVVYEPVKKNKDEVKHF
jgi:hypothetical protein